MDSSKTFILIYRYLLIDRSIVKLFKNYNIELEGKKKSHNNYLSHIGKHIQGVSKAHIFFLHNLESSNFWERYDIE